VFFFQAEDGIRDFHVTGVQTCALPIFSQLPEESSRSGGSLPNGCATRLEWVAPYYHLLRERWTAGRKFRRRAQSGSLRGSDSVRSEERRVGKECRSGGTPYE